MAVIENFTGIIFTKQPYEICKIYIMFGGTDNARNTNYEPSNR